MIRKNWLWVHKFNVENNDHCSLCSFNIHRKHLFKRKSAPLDITKHFLNLLMLHNLKWTVANQMNRSIENTADMNISHIIPCWPIEYFTCIGTKPNPRVTSDFLSPFFTSFCVRSHFFSWTYSSPRQPFWIQAHGFCHPMMHCWVQALSFCYLKGIAWIKHILTLCLFICNKLWVKTAVLNENIIGQLCRIAFTTTGQLSSQLFSQWMECFCVTI